MELGKIKRSVVLSLVFALLVSIFSMDIGFAESKDETKPLPTTVEVKKTYPQQNQEWVEVNPLIKFDFEEAVEIVDGSKLEDNITITSDGGKFAVDLKRDGFLSFEGNSLKIDINSIGRSGKFTLRKNTAYRVTIKEGTLRVKGRKDKLGKDILNKEEKLYFITGDKSVDANEGLVVKQYSSNQFMSDNITFIHSTQLDNDGEIFIHFNKKIQWNKYNAGVEKDSEALKHFKLYKKPHSYEKNTNLTDKSYMYNIFKQPIPSNLEQVDIESVQILRDDKGNNTNILKIKPIKSLLNLNEYKIVLDKKKILISFEDDVLRHDINQNIWTKPTNDKIAPLWDRDSSAEEIVEDENAPNKDYNIDDYIIYGAPNYGPLKENQNESKPITILIDKEVRLKPYNEGYLSPLEGVNLYENYKEGNAKVQIENYKIEYYFDIVTGIKRTKLLFYPKEELDSGKEYILEVLNGTFVSRGNVDLRGINLKFGVEGNYTRETGIYKTIVNVDGSYKNESINKLLDDYLKKDKDGNFKNKISLTLKGYNFNEDIESVSLRKTSSYQPQTEDEALAYRNRIISEGVIAEELITIPISDVKFHTVNEIEVNLQSSILEKLSKAVNLGTYSVEIKFKDKDEPVKSSARYKSSMLESIMSPCKQEPIPIMWIPYTDQSGVNHKDLTEIKICFDDPDGNLKQKHDNGMGFVDYAKTQEFSIINQGNDIRDKGLPVVIDTSVEGKICFKVPIKKSNVIDGIRDGMTYTVTIPEDLLRCKFDYHRSPKKTWDFTTIPIGEADSIFEGSIPEDYDPDYRIVLEGKDLSSTSKVIFKHLGNDNEYPTEINPTYLPIIPSNSLGLGGYGKLFVNLPAINKLPVGLYNIIIKTSHNLEDEYIYGIFSVVKRGTHIPNETDRDKDTTDPNVENVKEIIVTSKNKMTLNQSYRGRTIDLDSLLGDQALTREIKYEGNSLSFLDTKSKWSNVEFSDINKISSNEDMNIRLGRAEPQLQDMVKKKLKGYIVKSEFIIVGGENYIAKKLKLTIPYKNSTGRNLKVMRYDEETRRVYELNVPENNINSFDKTVTLEANSVLKNSKNTKGVFVIVE